MDFSITYKPLFHLNIYHEYFLNDGWVPFDISEKLKSKQLTAYDAREFIDIVPTEETYHTMNCHKMMYKPTKTGFTVLTQIKECEKAQGDSPKVPVPTHTDLNFLLYINDFLFENYSMVNAIPRVPFYFSNKKPASEGKGFHYINLEHTKTPLSSYRITETTWQGIGNQFSETEKESLFGVVCLNMPGDQTRTYDGNNRNMLNNEAVPKIEPKTFKIQMANRKTIWHYKNALNNDLLHSTEPKKLPLVKNGMVAYEFNSKKQPPASPNRLIFEKDEFGNVTKTISEIFIN
ncbi:hypothetical protein [Marixanthomonas spongiae]|uniref:Uncharacterized protein n=1 Tax=Marixanthomonas spongiae TaxID=2174845 RepID=A0A2U0I0Y3_9FLAO|nr:hypothetical protein [Marixanthomonas spongiae]PVW14759.1 hypothetical protein DDV96_09600 [Marixanthomonas spongiae]